jgi:hypothetical protein
MKVGNECFQNLENEINSVILEGYVTLHFCAFIGLILIDTVVMSSGVAWKITVMCVLCTISRLLCE